jgi:hypothetical protein
MNTYTLQLENDQLDNIIPFVRFCKENEHTDIKLVVNQESHCLRFCGVYDILDLFTFTSVTILTANIVEHHHRYSIQEPYDWNHWLRWDLSTFDHAYDYSWTKQKIFGCFYGRPSASRLGIASYVNPAQAVIKVRFNNTQEDNRKNFELQKLYGWHPEIMPKVIALLTNINQYQATDFAHNHNLRRYDYNNEINYLYKDIFVDLVVEPNVNGNSFYPTEKIARAILCRKPFIVMAPLFYLRYLQQMGFKTFADCWSESYDDLTGKNRYFSILSLIDQLSNLSLQQLDELNNKLQATIEHNYQLLINQQFTSDITRIHE